MWGEGCWCVAGGGKGSHGSTKSPPLPSPRSSPPFFFSSSPLLLWASAAAEGRAVLESEVQFNSQQDKGENPKHTQMRTFRVCTLAPVCKGLPNNSWAMFFTRSQRMTVCVCVCVCVCACACACVGVSWQCTTQTHKCACLAVSSLEVPGSVYVAIPRLLPMSLN